MNAKNEKTCILLNGPPLAGKDTALKIFKENLPGIVMNLKATDPIKAHAHKERGLDCDIFAFEAVKDKPVPEFGMRIPRDVYIETGRELKKKYGEDIIARLLANRAAESTYDFGVVSDVGDEMELNHVIDAIGEDNCLLIRIERAGCTFAGDCRVPVFTNRIPSFEVTNKNLQQYARDLMMVLSKALLIQKTKQLSV